MPYLIRLDLSGNRLNRVPQFNPVPFAIQELDLARNQITTISDLSCHKYLQKLCLDRNLIMKISGLDQCKSLTCLSLRNNGISKIENLDGLKLKVLDLVSRSTSSS
jgi:Leucine-rich repeat (LRR) protein